MPSTSDASHSNVGSATAGTSRGPRSLLASPGLPISLLYWAGAGLVALSALIHLHLWMTGYKQIHIIGPLILLQVIAGFGAALAIAVTRHFLIAVARAVFVAGTIAGLLISIEVGLFGFKDSFSASYAWTLTHRRGGGARRAAERRLHFAASTRGSWLVFSTGQLASTGGPQM